MRPGPIEYCCGFIFNEHMTRVALIRKNRPDWMAGHLNGIGGKLSLLESFRVAMRRECLEECGLDIPVIAWQHYHTETFDSGAKVAYMYVKLPDSELRKIQSLTDELVEIHPVEHVEWKKVVWNLPYLIHMAQVMDKINPYLRPLV